MSSHKIILFLIGLSLFFVYTDSATTTAYGDYKQSDFLLKTEYERLVDRMLVYVMVEQDVYNVTDNTTVQIPIAQNKAVYFPITDRFSQLNVPGSGRQFFNESDIYIYLNISNFVSEKRYYKQSNTPDKYVGYWTAIITMDQGKITGLSWDDNCGECYASECVGGTNCGIGYSDVDNCSDESVCNFMIYVAWVGTDSKGNSLTSLAYIPSKFNKYAFFPTWKAAAGISETYWFNSNAGYSVDPADQGTPPA